MLAKLDPMLTILAAVAVCIGLALWRAHRRPGFDFNLFDLLMENGRVSRLALWYNVSGAVSTWVIIDAQIKDKLSEGLFGLWLTAWVGSIIAKLVFNRTEPPGTTMIETTTINKKETVTEPAP